MIPVVMRGAAVFDTFIAGPRTILRAAFAIRPIIGPFMESQSMGQPTVPTLSPALVPTRLRIVAGRLRDPVRHLSPHHRGCRPNDAARWNEPAHHPRHHEEHADRHYVPLHRALRRGRPRARRLARSRNANRRAGSSRIRPAIRSRVQLAFSRSSALSRGRREVFRDVWAVLPGGCSSRGRLDAGSGGRPWRDDRGVLAARRSRRAWRLGAAPAIGRGLHPRPISRSPWYRTDGDHEAHCGGSTSCISAIPS